MLNKKIVIIILFLVLIVLAYFLFSKIENQKIDSGPYFLVLWDVREESYFDNIHPSYRLDKCSLDNCEKIDIFQTDHFLEKILREGTNLFFIRGDKVIKRNFVDKMEIVVYQMSSGHRIVGPLHKNGQYLAWESVDNLIDPASRFINIFDLENNSHHLLDLDYISVDEQVILYLDNQGQVDTLILEIKNDIQESELHFSYYDYSQRGKYPLVANTHHLFGVIKKEDKILFPEKEGIFSLDIKSEQKEPVYLVPENNCYFSSMSDNGQWLAEKNYLSGEEAANLYLVNLKSGDKYWLEKQNANCSYYHGYWPDNQYYLEKRIGYYFLLDLNNWRIYKPNWPQSDYLLLDLEPYPKNYE
ncbi:MAG: hypothetical protein PHO91_01465 [Patescibacteria group bacterium]|nr:hypothetical protein [Patescibacteria group bacterium]